MGRSGFASMVVGGVCLVFLSACGSDDTAGQGVAIADTVATTSTLPDEQAGPTTVSSAPASTTGETTSSTADSSTTTTAVPTTTTSASTTSTTASTTTTTTTTSTTSTTTGRPKVGTGEIDSSLQSVIDQAVAMLAAQLSIPVDDITIQSARRAQWSNSSAGCPEEGQAYLQVITDGSAIELIAGRSTYWYHSGRSDRPFLCTSPDRQSP